MGNMESKMGRSAATSVCRCSDAASSGSRQIEKLPAVSMERMMKSMKYITAVKGIQGKLARASSNKKRKGQKKRRKSYKQPSERICEIINYLKTTKVHDIKLKEKDIIEICYRSREQLMKDESMLDIEAPLVLVGDVHGQYEDLIGIFQMNGYPPNQRFLFLGDYVDRGNNSIETIILLLCYKLMYPYEIYLLRGNHETRFINRVYGFYEECQHSYSKSLWQIFQSVFNCLPLCARISNRIFCMHGGISEEIVSWKSMKKIRRPLEIPDYGVLCDLLWADPDSSVKGFDESPRGVSNVFGEDAVNNFCRNMDIDMIVRAHQVVQDGYEFFAHRRLVTIFSAPFYCGQFDNAAGMLFVDENLKCTFRIRRPIDHAWTKRTPKRAKKSRRRCKKRKQRSENPPRSQRNSGSFSSTSSSSKSTSDRRASKESTTFDTKIQSSTTFDTKTAQKDTIRRMSHHVRDSIAEYTFSDKSTKKAVK
ncbi:Serine/threonine-protein phosphatase PP1 isozyme 7 [Toxocara canis]|uniref:Serine/threonine-protein phosphatase n=1 Tax=Toxocara canis TaxID=6265 RepID=A0A0B2VN70_TOXCA|nr:Serine/threonine-protein phosphatase PP1 isozyme 7 [Toxocara canis]